MHLMLRLASWISAKLLLLLQPFFWYRDCISPPKLPPTSDSMFELSACQLAKKIRQGNISSESVVEAYIERIKEVEPFINSVVDNRFEDALREARHCDKMLEAGIVTTMQLELEKPFYGVPFTVKESCGLKGLSYTGCTLVRLGIKADEDSLIVESMRAAGGIPLCVTNTPELCSGFESTNPIYGTTLNPYDGRHSAGGSSGGEGALIAASGSLIGLGSDIGGSIRVPALFNGIFGHKPTPGIIPIKGHFPMVENSEFQKYLTLGPMTRYAEDLHMAVKVMTRDCKKNLRLDEPVDIAKLNVFYLEDIDNNFGVNPTSEDIRDAIRRAAKHFETCGAKISIPVIEELSDSCEITVAKLFTMSDMPPILIHPSDPKGKVNPYLELAKSTVGCSKYSKSAIFMAIVKELNGLVPESEFPYYEGKFNKLQEKLLKILDDNSVLFFPTFVTTAPAIGQSILLSIAGVFCLICNILGLPSTQVPMGLNKQGLPVGFQVIAAPHQDRLCLAVAKELEKAFGGWIPPTKV
ncbi:fatty-acid amide hydrolase 2-like [Microplitis mediator]|uniref:fatty-acid amide hydrolase 2-like n=1 Tax=Microplitis mediator TaxID=375433 RepID=UPI00255626D2|nr:fatty-acid amide hydrolase 2-like [Microplitis mediator]